MSEPLLFTEKYRPKTIDDCILPEELKKTLNSMITDKKAINLMLCGPPGCGKTTTAKCIVNQLGSDFIFLNGSLNVNIDKIRNDITEFASSVSFAGGRKFVIIDEADNLSSTVQLALRSFVETFANNCGFIFTCNYKHKIIDALHSRFSIIDYRLNKQQKQEMASSFYKRLRYILDNENIVYDKKVIQELIIRWFPDSRRILNEVQMYGSSGKIDSGILVNFSDTTYKQLITNIKAKEFTKIRQWVGENPDNTTFFTDFHKHCVEVMQPVALAQVILILGRYSAQHNICTDPEINITACLVELMLEDIW